ncbi:dehydrogenase/reductase SDR family member on chromosome X-like [Watersipora subatra]|uniref:dehydrogenase/reductase SDR family member on chromosome X-like n=1 Tax=Watersipora subatra TaxID=2589382 RepID=UPI00355C670F
MADPKKLVLLTGGNSGIGLEACKILCSKGYTVVASVRSDEKGDSMVSAVRASNSAADIHYMICEMADPESIRTFADEFKKKWLVGGRRLDVLVNNAGAIYDYPERQVADVNPEWEKTMIVNALGPITLTDLFVDDLKETALEKGDARVVMVNSSITTMMTWMFKEQIDFDDVMLSKPGAYKSSQQTYKLSKMALMMATLALSEELQDTSVKFNSICPGLIPGTNISNNRQSQRGTAYKIMFGLLAMMMGKSNLDGGQFIVNAADGTQGTTRGMFYVRDKLTSPNPQVAVADNQRRMLKILRDLAKSV